ncbi:hypothetical protein BJV74DRAFT_57962 [Russula compacta]|nr:hypothetical protein BJV74DRAFT_57962 [Russula compacta]
MPDLPAALLGTDRSAESLSSTLSPGIIGLFVQGLETGLIFAEFSSWFFLPERTESLFVVILTVFVTLVGFVQTGIYFASAWQIYVDGFGKPVASVWNEKVHVLLTTIIASPIQSLLLWRCYYIVRGNLYIIFSLLSLLLGSIVVSALVTAELFVSGPGHHSRAFWSPFFLYRAFPTVLDMALTCILLYYLTQTRKRVYTERMRQRMARLITLVFQSAIPPALCSAGIVTTYIISHHFHIREKQMWYATLQAMIGKLYILSLFYNLNTRTLFASEEPSGTTQISTLTVPTIDGASTVGLNTRETHEPTQHRLSVHPVDE